MRQLFNELKRRHIFRVAATYLVVAWLILQIITTISSPLQLPDWTPGLVIILLAVGFPIAVMLAWAFELTPNGIRPTSTNALSGKASSNRIWIFTIVLTLLFSVIFLILQKDVFINGSTNEHQTLQEIVSTNTGKPLNSQPRLAILPFENLSPDPDNAFFADGLHEEILSALANSAPGIEVISRTTMMNYRRNPMPLMAIASELHASHVLEGSVRRENDRVRLTIQLIDGSTDNHLWAENFDRTLSGALTLQSEVADAVAQQLAVRLSKNPHSPKMTTADINAYDFYLKALQAHGELQYGLAQKYLDQAIDHDKDFARAYAMKALEYVTSLNTGISTPATKQSRESLARMAKENAEKALQLDAALGVAYTALAGVHFYNWAWDDSRQAYENSLRLSPNDPNVLGIYAVFLSQFGNSDQHHQASEMAKKMAELDPGNPSSFLTQGLVYLYLDQLEPALRAFEKALELNPSSLNGISQLLIGITEARQGDYSKAINQLQNAERLIQADLNVQRLGMLIQAYGIAHSAEDTERLINQLKELDKGTPVSAKIWFRAYLGTGEIQEAVSWLDKAIEEHDIAELTPVLTRQHLHPALWTNDQFLQARLRIGLSGQPIPQR